MSHTFNPTNSEKLKRAEIITDLVLGTREVKNDEEATLKSTHLKLLAGTEIDSGNREALVESVYKTLGGAVADYKDETSFEEKVRVAVKALKEQKVTKIRKPKTK